MQAIACVVTNDKKVKSIGYSGYPDSMNYRPVNNKMDKDYYAGYPHSKLVLYTSLVI